MRDQSKAKDDKHGQHKRAQPRNDCALLRSSRLIKSLPGSIDGPQIECGKRGEQTEDGGYASDQNSRIEFVIVHCVSLGLELVQCKRPLMARKLSARVAMGR